MTAIFHDMLDDCLDDYVDDTFVNPDNFNTTLVIEKSLSKMQIEDKFEVCLGVSSRKFLRFTVHRK